MIVYDWILFFGFIVLLPKILFKRKLPSLRQRFGCDVPQVIGGTDVIWIHAVSVGEIKSAKGLLQKLKIEFPSSYVLVTTCTATGLEEAKRSLSLADAFYFLPIDFRWIMKKWIGALRPKLLIIVETDLWYNLMHEAKKNGSKIVLVSGKLSDRSYHRFKIASFFAKKLFSSFDLVLVQNDEHHAKFSPWVKNLHLGGNLKFDARPQEVDRKKWAPYFLGANFQNPHILITCTHEPEEIDLLQSLSSLQGTIYIAPRHPERFNRVADLLELKQIPYLRWSQIENRTGSERVILIDSMGILPIFYSFCQLTIVAGSFSSGIGGHNVLEPCLYGCPVFFGPSMHQQAELVARALQAQAGQQSTLETLASDISNFLANPQSFLDGAQAVIQHSHGALDTTWEHFKKLK